MELTFFCFLSLNNVALKLLRFAIECSGTFRGSLGDASVYNISHFTIHRTLAGKL